MEPGVYLTVTDKDWKITVKHMFLNFDEKVSSAS